MWSQLFRWSSHRAVIVKWPEADGDKQVCVYDAEGFLSCREFLGQGWMKIDKTERTPYIMKTSQHFNDVRLCVAPTECNLVMMLYSLDIKAVISFCSFIYTELYIHHIPTGVIYLWCHIKQKCPSLYRWATWWRLRSWPTLTWAPGPAP